MRRYYSILADAFLQTKTLFSLGNKYFEFTVLLIPMKNFQQYMSSLFILSNAANTAIRDLSKQKISDFTWNQSVNKITNFRWNAINIQCAESCHLTIMAYPLWDLLQYSVYIIMRDANERSPREFVGGIKSLPFHAFSWRRARVTIKVLIPVYVENFTRVYSICQLISFTLLIS